MDKPELKVGTIIIDNGRIGIITAIVENGVWSEMGPFALHKNKCPNITTKAWRQN